jgi:hypothetical protein|tara:strand:- start:1064 stop:1390 length:327 start_codon:yes stop_codon:yes gene_type:complete
MWITAAGYLTSRQKYVGEWTGDKVVRAVQDHNYSMEIQTMLRMTYGTKAVFCIEDRNIYRLFKGGRRQFVDTVYQNIFWAPVNFGAKKERVGDRLRKEGFTFKEDDYK